MDDAAPLTPRALYRAVLLAAFLVAAGLLLEQVVTLVVASVITVIVAIPASALATALERFRVPRAIGALLGVLALVSLFAGVFALVIPPVVEQARSFIDDLPQIADRASERIADLLGVQPARVGNELEAFLERYSDNPTRLLGPIASFSLTLLSIVAGIVFMLVTAYYIAVRPDPLVDGVLRVFPPARREHARRVMERLRRSWVGWLQGVGVDMVVTAVLLYSGLSLAGIEFALLFAVFSAVLVVVPYFGSIVGGIPPVLFALTDSPEKALLVLGIYLLVQQIEGNVIVPLVMAERVRLHPAVVAIGVLLVGSVFGLIGLVVSVPIISTAVILVDELWVKPREREAEPAVELAVDPTIETPDENEPRGMVEESPKPPRERQDENAQEPAGDDSLSWDQRRFLALLGVPAFALALAITLVTTYLPVFLAELSGPAVTGLLIGMEGLLALFVPLIAGTRSDETRTRLGRRLPYLLAATPVAAVSLVLMPLFGSLFALVLLLLLFYASYFTYYSPYYALYPDLVPDWARGRSQGFQNTLRELGLGGALVGGGVLLGLWRPLPFLVAAVLLTGLTLAFTWRIDEPGNGASGGNDGDEPGMSRLRRLIAEKRDLRWFSGAIGLWEFALAALKTFIVLFLTVGLGRSTGFASVVLAIVAAGVLVAAVAGGKLADRLGHARLLWVCVWVYGIGLAVPAFWHTPATLAMLPVVAFAAGVVMTLSYSVLMGMMPQDAHGAASGLYGFVRGAGVLLGPVAAGLAIQLLEPVFSGTEGYAALFLVCSAGVLASIPFLRVAAREAGGL